MKREEGTNKVKETKTTTRKSVIICEIIVNLLVIVRNNEKKRRNNVLETWSLYLSSTGFFLTT